MSLKKNSFFVIEKLSKYDALSKFNLKGVHLIPQLKSINFNIPLKDITSFVYKDSMNSESENIIKTKLFIILFFIFNSDPIIKNKTAVYQNEKKEMLNNENLVFKLKIVKKQKMYAFLTSFFLLSESSNIQEASLEKKQRNLKMREVMFFLDKFQDFNFFFNSPLISVNLNEYKTSVKFFFDKSDKKNIIESLPFFNLINRKIV